ncbi:MAG: HAMP domain-containing histidine kinase [Candidatus Sericytochromatia bacterium]|nr:HAMP domain-containing histidine kinase [Candidatus Sericytochromatia bacterium]
MLYKSIRFKITLAFSAVFTLISLFSGFIIYQNIKINIINSDNQELIARGQVLASKTDISPVIIPLANNDEMIRIDYINEKINKNIFTSINFPKDLKTQRPFSVIDLPDQRLALVDNPLNQDNTEKIRVFVTKPNIFLKKEISFLFYILLFSNFFSIILASLISYVLAGILLKPINNIIKTTKTITASQKMGFIEVPQTFDEIQMLSETINDMLRRIESSLNEQNNFFASASHELKTPLTILKTEIEVNLRTPSLSNEFKTFLISQLEEVSRLNRLIEDFLIVSQLNNQNLTLRFKIEPLDEIIFDVIDKVKSILKISGLKLNLELNQEIDDFEIKCDKDKLISVFINLVENAIKYASSESEIKIVINEDKNNHQFIIEIINKIDHQINNIEKLTDQFYRSDVLKNGYGLGLWISNKLINLHDSKISFTQEKGFFKVTVFQKTNI